MQQLYDRGKISPRRRKREVLGPTTGDVRFAWVGRIGAPSHHASLRDVPGAFFICGSLLDLQEKMTCLSLVKCFFIKIIPCIDSFLLQF